MTSTHLFSCTGAAAEKSETKTAKEVNRTEDPDEDADEDFVDYSEEDYEEDLAEEVEDCKPAPSEKAEFVVEDLDEAFCTMTISKPSSSTAITKTASLGFQFPYIMYSYIEDRRHCVSIDFLVIGMGKANFRPKVVQNGKVFQLGMVIPDFLVDTNRLQVANEGDKGFNRRTHKATAFEEIVAKITANHDGEEPLLGEPMKIALPIQCEEEIKDWEILAFDNADVEWCDQMECQQHFFLLSVDLIGTAKIGKEKKKGGFRKLGSPSKVVNKEGNNNNATAPSEEEDMADEDF
jgi:hypothetical protein